MKNAELVARMEGVETAFTFLAGTFRGNDKLQI
jgi:hypothetical protein